MKRSKEGKKRMGGLVIFFIRDWFFGWFGIDGAYPAVGILV
jgi:hypothetical protein